MLKFITITAVTAALCLQPAAAKLGGAQSVTETGDRADRHENVSVVSYLIDQIRISFLAITHSTVSQSGNASDEHGKKQNSYTKRECDGAHQETDEDTEAAEATDQQPVGPTPLYFGF
jgi:hypothetical protein